MAKILLVEDDKRLCNSIQDWMEHYHFAVEIAYDGNDGLALLQASNFDVVILDVNVPGIDGFELCRRFRSGGGSAPVLILTGQNQIVDKKIGFSSGADDYLTKPFHMDELVMRVQALLRRSGSGRLTENVLKAGDLTLDPSTFGAFRGDERVNLSRIEFALLEFFMRHPKQVFSPEAILSRVWASGSETSTETVRTTLKRLRSKIDLEGKPSMIQNIHGVGYCFEDQADRA